MFLNKIYLVIKLNNELAYLNENRNKRLIKIK